jgi:4-aminobutyrate aminotransferase
VSQTAEEVTVGQTVEEKYSRYVNTSCVAGIEPVAFERAEGAVVTAKDGREYLDLFAGISVVNVGHRHPRVVAAARAQLERYIHCASYIYYSEPVADLAELLARVTPGALQKTFFANSGAEAIEGSMRLAKAYSGRTEFIALQLAFHGRTAGTLSVTGNMMRKTHGAPYLSGVAFAPPPYAYRCRFCRGSCNLECANAVEDTVRAQTSGDVAAFLAEPILGEGGIIVPHPDYFKRVKAVLDSFGILFICDEVQTGFGRTGTLFAIEQFGVEPDIMAMAKGIADGFPLGAFIAPASVADSFHPGEHLSTFGGNAVSCAAGIETIKVLADEQLAERAKQLEAVALPRLQAMTERHPIAGEARGLGLMLGIELVRDRATKEPAAREAQEVRRLCRLRGVLIGVGGQYGNVVRMQPPLVISEDQLDGALSILDESLAEVGGGA